MFERRRTEPARRLRAGAFASLALAAFALPQENAPGAALPQENAPGAALPQESAPDAALPQESAPEAIPLGLEAWPAAALDARVALERRLVDAVSRARLSEWHTRVASFPHVAGTAGDERMIGQLAEDLAALGLEVEVQPFVAYLARPIAARLELVSPAHLELSLREAMLPEAPFSASSELDFGWNAYSGSGTVEGELVYANYGRKEDFEALDRLGVDCRGKIVLARYGGNYRGYKAFYAERAGAAGLVVFTDPKDAGFARGAAWPEGGWANDSCIQRGSIAALPWIGDPLTPDVAATEDAERLDPASVPLPRIPVQPIGFAAALQLLAPMQGEVAPEDWQGGLPLRYRLTGGEGVRARLMVEQERRLVRTANVLATLRGRDAGERGDPLGPRVIVGCHHDAWGYGASDPTSGLIALLESARVLAAEARSSGARPRRSITFAAFGAEEFGIVGSAEFVESRRAELTRDALLYVNLDAAANGLDFGAAATPEARELAAGVLAAVPQPVRASDRAASDRAASDGAASDGAASDGAASDRAAANGAAADGEASRAEAAEREPGADPIRYASSVLDAWWRDGTDAPPFGELGGGSDHAPFVALAAVPSIGLSAGGAPGNAYHSIYDDLTWYRRIVGADYASAQMIARVATLCASRAADAPLPPIALAAGPAAAERHLGAAHLGGAASLGPNSGEGLAEGLAEELAETRAAFAALAERARATDERLREVQRTGRSTAGRERALAELLARWPRVWLDEAGLPARPWFRNLYVAPDETSGYASAVLPGLRHALDAGDAALAASEAARLRAVARRAEALLARIEAELAEGE